MPPTHVTLIIGCAAWLGSVASFLAYRKFARRCDIIREVPTIAAADIPGLGAAMVEVVGQVEVDTPLISDLTRAACVALTCSVTEHWTTTHIERDSKGNSRTVTRHHSETRYSNDQRIPFRVRDASGQVVVRPEGADIDLINAMAGRGGPDPTSPAYYIMPRHFGGRLKYAEQVLPVGEEIYVLGQVSIDHEIVQPTDVDRPFLISHRSEEEIQRAATWGKTGWGITSFVLFVGGFVALTLSFSNP
jgi:hypothetical protein